MVKRSLIIVITFLMCIAVLTLVGCEGALVDTKQTAGSTEPPKAEKTGDAFSLSDLYETDPAEAEASITGKIVEITGTVDRVSESSIYLDRESIMGYIICTMSTNSDDYSNLLKGDKVVIVGTVKGEFGHITVDDCYYLGYAEETVNSET